MVEYVIVAFLPNAPGANHKKIHEERYLELGIFMRYHLTNANLDLPLNAEDEPSSCT